MSPDEFRELLQRKGASAECPVCGAEDWRGLDDVIDLPVRVAGDVHEGAHVRIPGFAALAPSCGRCGHVRLIDLRLLEAPRQEEPETVRHREPPHGVEVPNPTPAEQSTRTSAPLTNIWGDPISPRRGRKR